MNILIVSDVHNKDDIIRKAEVIMELGIADRTVFLGDFVDDWHSESNVDAYIRTLRAVIEYVQRYPETMICLGNHDIQYIEKNARRCSGYSISAGPSVSYLLCTLKEKAGANMAYVHTVGNFVFSHAGLSKSFIERYFGEESDVEDVVDQINQMNVSSLSDDDGPLWFRASKNTSNAYRPKGYTQIIGHDSVNSVFEVDDVIFTDVFSRGRYGKHKAGSFLLVDTVTHKWEKIDYHPHYCSTTYLH